MKKLLLGAALLAGLSLQACTETNKTEVRSEHSDTAVLQDENHTDGDNH